MTEPYLVAIQKNDLYRGAKLSDEEWVRLKAMLSGAETGFQREILEIVDEFAEMILSDRKVVADAKVD